ncbi:MAG: CRTAC1 family protein [Opitutaceae bacterium]|nr:CRTAC1 family protein [Opitutaceae bacterium]
MPPDVHRAPRAALLRIRFFMPHDGAPGASGLLIVAGLACALGGASAAPLAAQGTGVMGGSEVEMRHSGPGHAVPTEAQIADAVPSNDSQPESNRRMALLIQQIYRGADLARNNVRSTEQIPMLREALASGISGKARIDLQNALATHLLQSGLPDEALAEFQVLERLLRTSNIALDGRNLPPLMTSMALCHLRLGEQENCLYNHNADSCLFPIAGGGVHQLQRGSRAAVEQLTALLKMFPGDLRARWLLNVAYMTLGEYPDKVPPRWLLEPKLFASEYDIRRFPDVAAHVGLAVNDLAGGVVMEDFDRDGFLDLMVSAWGFNPSDQMRVFRNNGDGTFTERTREAGLLGLVSGLNMIQGDLDNDGFADVLVLRGAWLRTEGHYPLSLLRNNGDFTFTDVTEQAGLLRFRPTQAAVWFDFNSDGWLDIFIGNESAGRDANPCELFRNNGDGTFTECAAEHGVDFVGFFKGVASGDYNNDGRPDLYLSRRDGENKLLRNDGPARPDSGARAPWRFTDVAPELGVTEPLASFPCWFWDYNNDGWPDIGVTGYQIQDVGDIAADLLGRPHAAERARLYRNNGDGTFTDVSREAGLRKVLHTMGCNFGDLDNDGWLDLYLGTGDPDFATLIPNRMFRNDGGRRFQDVTTAGGFGQLQKGHGIAFGDLDNDGDQDIYSAVGGAVEADHYPNQLFANPGSGGRWLKLTLEGVRTNRLALGARVRVIAVEDGVERVIHRTVGSGASFGSSTFRLEIGLGAATAVRRVEVDWPVAGRTDIFTGIEPENAYHLREGAAAPVPVALARFELPLAPDPSRPMAHGHHGHGSGRPVEWCAPSPVP